jgi:hypothetical protein
MRPRPGDPDTPWHGRSTIAWCADSDTGWVGCQDPEQDRDAGDLDAEDI